MYEFSATSGLRKLFSLFLKLAYLPLFLMVLWVFGLFACQPLTLLLLPPYIIFVAYGLRKKGFHLCTWTGVFCLAAFGVFCLLPGPSDEQWSDLVQRTPRITPTNEATLHIADIRDAVYRRAKDYDLRYLEEDFKLNDVVSVSLAELFRGDGSEDSTLMLSFEFKDGRYLVFSPAVRVPMGSEENSIGSHYKNNGLVYLFGTEEDFFLSATDMNHARLYLYPLAATPQQSAEMLALCARMANDTNSNATAYIPLRENYHSGILGILRRLCPALPSRRPVANNDVARLLYLNGALQKQKGGDWSRVRRDFAVGNDISQGERDSYSDKLRKRIGVATRSLIPVRRIQEEVSVRPLKAEKEQPAAPVKTTAADIPEPSARLQQDTRTSVADIPEPGDRLRQDTRPHTTEEPQPSVRESETKDSPADEQSEDTPKISQEAQDIAAATRELDKQQQVVDLPKQSAAAGILEPGARMDADARREAEEDAELAASRKRAAEGHDIMDDGKQKDGDSRFSELFFGKRSSGIKIIEKAKPQEEPHPLDPHRKQKKKTPFDDEEQQQKQKEPKEVDPFAKPAPVRI